MASCSAHLNSALKTKYHFKGNCKPLKPQHGPLVEVWETSVQFCCFKGSEIDPIVLPFCAWVVSMSAVLGLERRRASAASLGETRVGFLHQVIR